MTTRPTMAIIIKLNEDTILGAKPEVLDLWVRSGVANRYDF